MQERYIKNIGSYYTEQDQKIIFNTTVGIIGVGGVGGEIALLLSRLGIKKIILFDGDNYSISNLNRQSFCTMASLYKNKALVAKEYLQSYINPDIIIDAYPRFFKKEDYNIMLEADIIFNEADSFINFFELMETLKQLMLQENKIIISSSLEYIGISTITFTKNSIDHFNRIVNDTPGLLELEKDKDNFNHSISQLGYLATLAAAQGVDVFIKIICNKNNAPIDQRLLYNIYDNTLYHIRYKEDEQLLYNIYKQTLPTFMDYNNIE